VATEITAAEGYLTSITAKTKEMVPKKNLLIVVKRFSIHSSETPFLVQKQKKERKRNFP
jgi:hypothetical protein